MDNFNKFQDTELPPIKNFYSKLSNKNITQEDYEHAQLVWEKFNIKNMGEYHDLYLLLDVLQLSDVFEEFRTICNKNYELDPAYYLTAPSLSFDACLKTYEKPVILFNEHQSDMYLFIERSIRGGISIVKNHYSKAKNEYLPDYDKTKETKFIMFDGMNNLYGWAMNQCLPVGIYE